MELSQNLANQLFADEQLTSRRGRPPRPERGVRTTGPTAPQIEDKSTKAAALRHRIAQKQAQIRVVWWNTPFFRPTGVFYKKINKSKTTKV